MRLRVGQRVRLLHDKGEGVITELIDKHHIEVDFDGDFPMEVHIDEIVPVSEDHQTYFGDQTSSKSQPIRSADSIFEISLAFVREEEDQWKWYLINPEPIDILYTCYIKLKSKYQGIASGSIQMDEAKELTTMNEAMIESTKAVYVQLLPFKMGKGHPHTMDSYEIPWNKYISLNPSRFIEALGKTGWLMSLRQRPTILEEKIAKKAVSIKKGDLPARKEKVVDLHIEELVSKPHLLMPSEILHIQLEKADQALADAIAQNCASITFIHGVGEGRLRNAVREVLASHSAIKTFYAADPSKYGNGATKAELV